MLQPELISLPMRKLQLLIACILISLFSDLHSQDFDLINRDVRKLMEDLRFSNPIPESENTSINGTRYLNNDFAMGEIHTRKSETFEGIPMRYNAYSGELELKFSDGLVYELGEPERIESILMNDERIVYSAYIEGKDAKRGYLFVAYHGQSSLYVRKFKAISPGRPSNGIVPEIRPSYTATRAEHFVTFNGSVPRLCTSVNDFLDMLPDKEKEMRAFLRKERIRGRVQTNDLIRALEFYDGLQ
jgi:hypothetical protein